jgi:patatin-like phospholipase/acyl hydrolase
MFYNTSNQSKTSFEIKEAKEALSDQLEVLKNFKTEAPKRQEVRTAFLRYIENLKRETENNYKQHINTVP